MNDNAGPSTIENDDEDKGDDKDAKKKKNRCAICRKKVGLTGKFIVLFVNLNYLDTFKYLKLIYFNFYFRI